MPNVIIPPSLRGFVGGVSGSGKTRTARDLYVARFPRCIVMDQTGEWKYDVSAVCHDVDSVIAAVTALAPRGRWVISYSNADNGFESLVNYLIPVPLLHTSPVMALGGMCLLVDEVDLLAPAFGSMLEYIRSLYRRSRHCGLSVISCTQRPANVSREVTSQCTQIIAHALSEPRDRDYMANLLRWGPDQTARWIDWTRKHRHGCVWKDLQTGDCRWLTRR